MNHLSQERNRFAIRANRTINSHIKALSHAKQYATPEVALQVDFAIAVLRDVRHELAGELAFHHFSSPIIVQRVVTEPRRSDEFEADCVEAQSEVERTIA
jgi:hypothetical protein